MALQFADERFELSKTIAGEGHDHEVEYFNRFVFWNSGAFTMVDGSPHSDSLTKEGEHGTAHVVLARFCPGKGMERACWSELLDESAMSMVTRAIARINDVASDKVVLSRCLSERRQGTDVAVKRTIWHLQACLQMRGYTSKKNCEELGSGRGDDGQRLGG